MFLSSQFINYSLINQTPDIFSNDPVVVYLKNRHDRLCEYIVAKRDKTNQAKCITLVKAEAAGSI